MPANSRMATAVQILCVLARFPPGGTTAVTIARSLDTNPVVVRRLMKDLALAGLVRVQPGKSGGVQLARPASDISLEAVRRAAEEGASVFAIRPGGNPRCPVNQAMPALLSPIFSAVDDAVSHTLSATTLAHLAGQLPPRVSP